MSNTSIVAASVLAANFGAIASQVAALDKAGSDWFHLDVMDGHFVPPITFGDAMIKAVKAATNKPLDVHLMVTNPEEHLESFRKAGADLLTVHQETCPHLHKTLMSIRALGAKAGVAINPGTPTDSILDVLPVCDLVLVMTVNPGFGGQKFIDSCVDKISTLRHERAARNLSFQISVDGGITDVTAKLCRAAGAEIFVSGTYLFSAKDSASAVASLRS